jgi:methylenetetrahydrofolate dehydrogenase (NADP+)/methenyltetrahydrofolate cyclohydrolase
MIIDGTYIAGALLDKLTHSIENLRKKEIQPTLAIILVGDDPGSLSYVRQKEKAAEKIGALVQTHRYDSRVSIQEIQSIIKKLNNSPAIHGIIIQRPLPIHLQDESLLNSINPTKDVDGFVTGSPCEVPVAMAVDTILRSVFVQIQTSSHYNEWLTKQRIVVIGKGETAGKPIGNFFTKNGCQISLIDSITHEEEKKRTMLDADIIISCVGKKRIVQKEFVKKDTILISVGIWRDNEGKLHGDYENDEVKNWVSFYTPTPGGVGPVNVACLMENLVHAIAV